jgi:hypothetical protein
MMEDNMRKSIRRILKSFGIEADETLMAHLARHPDVESLKIRITVEDLTEYGDSPPQDPLTVTIEDEIQR